MWKMLDDDMQCDECGGPGPPPAFLIPPPPRPPFMQELTKCSAEDPTMDYDMCEAIPILDASYHSSPSLQTSAMIAVFSLLLVLVVLISSLFVWKHKRKVQNFLPCKTPTRGGHLGGGVSGGHSVTYEDPDAHLGHRPLVMRHHHNVEMLPPKSIHYPSGYPMTRTPPLFVCSSPGPDPYRSNDNVYEELGPGRDSDGESEQALHSDDDFAEDELSLPGDRSFQKNSPEAAAVATIYHERVMPSLNSNIRPNHERNSLISSSTSSSNMGSNSAADHHGLQQRREHSGILAGLVRPLAASVGKRRPCNNTNGNSFQNNQKGNTSRKHSNCMSFSTTTTDDMNTSSEHTAGSDIVPSVYDERNLMSLAFSNHHHHNNHQHYANNSVANSNTNNNNNNNSALNGSTNNNNSCNATSSNRLHYYAKSTPGLASGLESEVERRNRINKQLHHPPPVPVSTIFRERGNYNSLSRPPQYPQPYYTHHSLLGSSYQGQGQGHPVHTSRSRTNPRSLDRRRIAVPIDHEPAYGYAEPVFHEGLIYNACMAHPSNAGAFRTHLPTYPCILPDYTSYRTLANGLPSHYYHTKTPVPPTQQDLLQPQIYSRDSSFGSDSGYSHQTQASSGGGGEGCDTEGPARRGNTGFNRTDSGSFSNSNSMGTTASCGRPNSNSGTGGVGPKIGCSFAWSRRMAKDNSSPATSIPSTPTVMAEAISDTESPVATMATTATKDSNPTNNEGCNNANVVANNNNVNNNNNNSTTNNISSSCNNIVQSKTFEDS